MNIDIAPVSVVPNYEKSFPVKCHLFRSSRTDKTLKWRSCAWHAITIERKSKSLEEEIQRLKDDTMIIRMSLLNFLLLAMLTKFIQVEQE